jgi:hypothetical protein
MANADPIYISINNTAPAVLAVMDGLAAKRTEHMALVSKRRNLPRTLFLAGLPFIGIDWLMGYNFLTFTLVTAGLWGAAIAVSRGLAKARMGPSFPNHFKTAREVIYTLRDDPDPKRNLFGHVDLSGAQQPAKRFREGTNAAGKAMEYFRDEWLSLKTKLYDGNMLRLSVIERVKVRKSYWKRSAISGKMKLKPAKVANAQQIKVRLSVNPLAYEIAERSSLRVGGGVGRFAFTEVSTAGGIIDVTADSTLTQVPPKEILDILWVIYDQLERKA